MRCSLSLFAVGLSAFLVLTGSCSSYQKLSSLKTGELNAALELSEEQAPAGLMAQNYEEDLEGEEDTLKVLDPEGREIFLMRAVKDEKTGEMVANERIKAAVVTARFRNVAERGGKVNLGFRITVPADMLESGWQLRLYPYLVIQDDTLRLDRVYLTGKGFRSRQLRGYEHYARFVSRIVTDTTLFLDRRAFELFLQRNYPAVYAFGSDSSFVSEEEFSRALSFTGVSAREAMDHYLDKFRLELNRSRAQRQQEVFRKSVRVPMGEEGVRLDSLILDTGQGFEYDYFQSVAMRPGLKKIKAGFEGAVYDQDRMLCALEKVPELDYYVSTPASLADMSEKYLQKVVLRSEKRRYSARIAFRSGSFSLEEDFLENREEIDRTEGILRNLMGSDTFSLDSVSVCSSASPEGNFGTNRTLSRQRAETIARHFERFCARVADSLEAQAGVMIELDDSVRQTSVRKSLEVKRLTFTPVSFGENWALLDSLVSSDTLLTLGQKEHYHSLSALDADRREELMQKADYYPLVRQRYYPELRRVDMEFFLSRKGMLRDTLITTTVDTLYMRGVQCLRDSDYEGALEILAPYSDFNAALAYLSMDRNRNALLILSSLQDSAAVEYLRSIAYMRLGDDKRAVEEFLKACRKDRKYISRGNLDPEISTLVDKYSISFDNEIF
ncbi:MAG: hypothetical protein ACI3Y7_03255 [Candidatus Cryptobacteroides sp.]